MDPPTPCQAGDTPGEPGCAMQGSLVGLPPLWRAIPFQQVEAELVAVGQGEQLHAGAHPHEPLHLHCHTQYPGNLVRKVRAD